MRTIVTIVLALVAAPAFATNTAVPEPPTLGLLAAGAVIGLVAWLRSRR